jgi:hypothetical protein
VKFINTSAVIKGDGNPGLTIVIIRKMLEAEACRKDSPAPTKLHFTRGTWTPPRGSLEYLRESTQSLQEALHQGLIMGIRMAWFNMTKSLEDYRFTLDQKNGNGYQVG